MSQPTVTDDDEQHPAAAVAATSPSDPDPRDEGGGGGGGRRTWTAGTLRYTAAGLALVFFWLLLGDFAYQLKERSVQPALIRLLKVYHASDTAAGILIGSLPQLIGVFFGPVIAFRSDRHRGRWGRRIPYLLAVTPPTVAAMVGLAYSPVLGRHLAAAGLLRGRVSADVATIGCFGLFWMIFEFGTVTCNTLLIGLVNDVVPRQLIGRFFGLFRVFSVAAGMVFMYFMMGRVVAHYWGIFVGMGAVYGVCFTGMCFGVREPAYPPPPDDDGAAAAGPWAAAKTYLRECFTRPYYLWYFASVTAAYVAFQPINVFTQYFAQSVGVSDDWYGKLSTAQFGLSLGLSFPLGWLADRIHPLRVVMLALAAHGTATLCAFALVRGPTGFAVAHVLCGALAGAWITGWYALTPAVVPRAKFAQYFSAMTICCSGAQIVGGFAFGWLFDHIHHEYRYMYLIACLFDFFAVALTLVVLRHYRHYGGLTPHYTPPE